MILLTGASGFLGQAIIDELGSAIKDTIGRSNCSINVDLSRQIPIISGNYNLIIHAAGKAHSVPKTKAEKDEFFAVNLKGTLNLLTGLEKALSLPKSFIFISSVAVYGKEAGVNIDENVSLSATDPYGRSKVEAEEIVQNWCKKNDVICTILRLPLLAGSNPPGNLGSMIRGIQRGYYFNIAGGKAKKSIVLVADVARVLMRASEIGGVYNLTDGYNPSFSELANHIAHQLDKSEPLNLPAFFAKSISLIGDLLGDKFPINSKKLKKITSDLTFDDAKAKIMLGWKPAGVLSGFKIK